ncbi:MAG: hypothetical protein LUC31_00995 [Coprobacillus sp.]|nr:hypothetical protein [Coprobacillus sp.]
MDFLEHLKTYLSDSEIEKLDSSLKERPLGGALLNTKKMSKEKLLSLFPSLEPHPLLENGFIYHKDEDALSKSVYYELGCYYLQEPSAMSVASFLPIEDDDVILDLCSAPGGKSIGVALRSNDTNLIISNDNAYTRLLAVEDNISKMGLDNIIITHNDFRKNNLWCHYITYFDSVIVDAPCSGSGMMRKESKMRDDWHYNKVMKYSEVQKDLIELSADMVKEGGYLLYSTCSFSQEEDEDIIEWLLSTRGDFEVVDINTSPLFCVNKKKPLGIHFFPSLFPGEGQYVCLLRKSGHKKESKIHDTPTKESVMYQNIFKENPLSHYLSFKGSLFTLPRPLDKKLLDLNIIYPGTKIGELDNTKVNKYDYHYARILKEYPNQVEINEEELHQYITGHPLDNKKEGIALLSYDHLPLSFTKGDGRILKNWYPKIK